MKATIYLFLNYYLFNYCYKFRQFLELILLYCISQLFYKGGSKGGRKLAMR